MNAKKKIITLGRQEIILETGKVAKQAAGSCFLHCGETSILATACMAPKATEEGDFLPLRVDYQEKFSSAGKTLGGFIKREGKPTTHEILVSRFIDRTIRPIFDEGLFNEVQVLASVYSYDNQNTPDVLGICAASAALSISDIPFPKPIGAVRVGKINDTLIINPSKDEQKQSSLDLVLGGTEDALLMIEGYSDFLTEEEILSAIELGHESIKIFCQNLKEWQQEVGKEKKNDILYRLPEGVFETVQNLVQEDIEEALKIAKKQEREDRFKLISSKIETELLSENSSFSRKDIFIAYQKLSSNMMREMVLREKKRIDGRKVDEIRPINIEVGTLRRTHGSCLFTRGETQSLAVCTLGGETMAQKFEDIYEEGSYHFYLQYFFPPFSVGEVGRLGAPGRREIGHGKLAERALFMTLPDKNSFPYVIRLESNILESNGSSSMASVCGGCLALMDAGVPIKKVISGIAMGLILEKNEFVVLSDILGAEDALGDMDFKVAGDADGITAFQMDIKVEGITLEIMKKALEQAKKGRKFIQERMIEILPRAREEVSRHAPLIKTIQIKTSQIGAVIGPGGKQIRAIEELGVKIDIREDGFIMVVSTSPDSIEKALLVIHELTDEVEVGKIYKGKITGIKPFGLFVSLSGGKEGLCHISEISHSRINNLESLYKEGDYLEVKVLEINDLGQIRLSHKVLLK